MNRRLLYNASLMIFFWSIFDGIISYITPLVITAGGLSKTTMGLIYSGSSVFGAVFDFLLSKFLKNTHYRKLFFLMFAICFGYPFLLWKAYSVFLFIVAMAFWGLYYDLMNFGCFDFVSRTAKTNEHSSSFGVLGVFKSLGYLIAPLLAGWLVVKAVETKPFLAALLFLAISFLFYLLLLSLTKNGSRETIKEKIYKPVNVLVELHIWKKVGLVLLPVLIFTMLLYVFDAFFWTLGPLYSQDFKNFSNFGGLFMTMYTLPTLLTGWVVGRLTKKFGQKRTAFVSFLIFSVCLSFLALLRNPYLILSLVFFSSMIGSLAWPAIKGAFVDYITESFKYEKEIEGLGDFFINIGYVLGPMLAGFFSDKIGNSNAFSVLGMAGVLVTLVLMVVTPKEIKIAVKD